MTQKNKNPWSSLVKVRGEQDSPSSLSIKSKVDQWYEELIDEPANEPENANMEPRRDGPLKTTAE